MLSHALLDDFMEFLDAFATLTVSGKLTIEFGAKEKHQNFIQQFSQYYDDEPNIMDYVLLNRSGPYMLTKEQLLVAMREEIYVLIKVHAKPVQTKRNLHIAIVLLLDFVGGATIDEIMSMLDDWNPFGIQLTTTNWVLQKSIWCNFGKLANESDFLVNRADGKISLSASGITQSQSKYHKRWTRKYPTVMNKLRS